MEGRYIMLLVDSFSLSDLYRLFKNVVLPLPLMPMMMLTSSWAVKVTLCLFQIGMFMSFIFIGVFGCMVLGQM